jgi:hypothetical protein
MTRDKEVIVTHILPRGQAYKRGVKLSALKQELIDCIGLIPDEKLAVVKPILKLLANESNSHVVIETDLTDEEKSLIAKGMKEYEANPASFTSLEDIDCE